MPTLRPSAPPQEETPEQNLLRALKAAQPEQKKAAAERGLAAHSEPLEPDTEVLLLRQLYLAHVELRQLRRAAEIATEAASLGPLSDIAWHDASRAYAALGDSRQALLAQRSAARAAPAERRSFQLWGLATLQHHAGDVEGALATLRRGLRSARRDRALLRAHAAYIRLDAGLPVRNLRRTLDTLRASPNAEGYGRFLAGMIAHCMGDQREASVHLRAFLRRNAAAGAAKELTLREEFRRARVALARIDSD